MKKAGALEFEIKGKFPIKYPIVEWESKGDR
jgi:hypothetical protein